MIYIETIIELEPYQPWSDILISSLAEINYESFTEQGNCLHAFIKEVDFSSEGVEKLEVLRSKDFTFKIIHNKIESKNWNKVWEENFNPVLIDGFCCIRASFHPKPAIPFDIIIDPRMAFGTGHHETTRNMIRLANSIDFAGKTVLDMGCGTGALGIFAALKGAEKIIGVDNDPLSIENTKDNISINRIMNFDVQEGDAKILKKIKFRVNIIFANINRNVLINDIPVYSNLLEKEGFLLLSGFFRSDEPALMEAAGNSGLRYGRSIYENDWAAMMFHKDSNSHIN